MVAGMVLAGVILGRFADEPLPASYLIRPLLVAAAIALVLGVLSQAAGRYALAVAAGAALLVALPDPRVLIPAVGVLIGAETLRRRGWGSQSLVLVLVGTFFGVGLVRAIQVIELFPTGPEVAVDGSPMYVILLDGYPRLDSLADLGIDNQSFIDALSARGFDHYPDATSIHTQTNQTLLAMLTSETVSDEPVSVAERRAIRRRLVAPPGFVVVDPPVGDVTLGPGRHIDPGGLNDFEAELVGQSALGRVAPDWAWSLLLADLRDRLDRTLDLIEASDEPRIFAHLMAPHPPFLYGPGGSKDIPRWCWPNCGFGNTTIESLSVEIEPWVAGMAAQLEYLDTRLLRTIDSLLARHPEAVIVVFSDHGSRYSEGDLDEMHRTFLAARTPGYPGLFAAAPRPDTIIRTLLAAYP
jgi:hypothetical protein